jgi:hypothetical protein
MQMFEKSHEWNVPVWIESIDFQKAFDTVEHQSLWNGVRCQSVPETYVKILSNYIPGRLPLFAPIGSVGDSCLGVARSRATH